MELELFEEYLWQAAGLGASCVMEKAPHIVLPTVEIEAGMKKILAEVREKENESNLG